MRSFTWLSSGSALGRFGPMVQRLRQSVRARRPAVRWGLAAVTLSVLVLLGYLGTASLTTPESSCLGLGRPYSWDDLIKIGRTLDHQRIPYRIDDQRRVAVAWDQREQAEAAIAKLELGRLPPGEIRDSWNVSRLWDSFRDKEMREQQGREKILESLISDLPGIVGSFVWVNRPKARWGLQPVAQPSAFVRLETEGDRQLPFRTVQSITTILTGSEPSLTADAVTVVDRRGHKYLDAGNPALSALSHNRAREEELSQEILEKLDWIQGVRVSVQLPDTMTTDPKTVATRGEPERPELSEPTAARPAPGVKEAEPHPHATSSRPRISSPEALAPIVAVNRPLGAVESFPTPGPPAAAQVPPRASPAEPGRVWVKVPRSYYYHISIFPSHKEPPLEELQKLVARTEEQIKTGIALVVPVSGPAAWKTTIDVIPDEVPLNRPPVLSPPADARRVALDWGTAGALGAMAAALVMFGTWILSVRRPAGRPEEVPRRLHYHGGSSITSGPSERLREFVRRSPESAASVLERWTRQGGEA